MTHWSKKSTGPFSQIRADLYNDKINITHLLCLGIHRYACLVHPSDGAPIPCSINKRKFSLLAPSLEHPLESSDLDILSWLQAHLDEAQRPRYRA